jgi:sigma-E factor negative regulatory protein RseB
MMFAVKRPLALVSVYFSACALSLLMALSSSAPAWAGESSTEVRQWFDKMSRAGQTLSYEGTFMYRRGEQVMTMKIIHVADGQGERERIISLNGPLREIVRDRKGVAHISADNKKPIRVDTQVSARSLQSKTPEQIAQIEKYYTFSLAGDARTANRRARVINISPKDIYRYGYRVSLDHQTGLLLQSELLSEEGAPLEQIIFITFNVLDKNRIMALDIPPAAADEQASTSPATEAALPMPPGDEGWKISKMPEGFALVERNRRMNKSGGVVEHLVFTDGLASVSVFMEKNTPHDKTPFTGVSRMGAVNAFARRVSNHQITVVGEVPVAAVRMIGESFQGVTR